MARRCGPKHICKSKCTKHLSAGPVLDVTIWKLPRRCGEGHLQVKMYKTPLDVTIWKIGTPLWREAHLQVKMHKTPGLWRIFGPCDGEKVSDKRDR